MAVDMSPEDFEYEDRKLRQRRCPWTSEPLTRGGDAGPESLSCEMCDCFGYDPKDTRLGPVKIQVRYLTEPLPGVVFRTPFSRGWYAITPNHVDSATQMVKIRRGGMAHQFASHALALATALRWAKFQNEWFWMEGD